MTRRVGISLSTAAMALCVLDVALWVVEHFGPHRWHHALWIASVTVVFLAVAAFVAVWAIIFVLIRRERTGPVA